MSKRLTSRQRRKLVLKCLFCIFLICVSIILSIGNVVKINEKNKEKSDLLIKLEELEDEEKTLSDDVEKLKNPEYAARYAREKYLYSKSGEKILKID